MQWVSIQGSSGIHCVLFGRLESQLLVLGLDLAATPAPCNCPPHDFNVLMNSMIHFHTLPSLFCCTAQYSSLTKRWKLLCAIEIWTLASASVFGHPKYQCGTVLFFAPVVVRETKGRCGVATHYDLSHNNAMWLYHQTLYFFHGKRWGCGFQMDTLQREKLKDIALPNE